MIKVAFSTNKIVHSLSIFIAVALGVCSGLFLPSLNDSILGLNNILSNLLRMCVIPIVVSSLIVEIVSFLKSAKPSSIKKFISISLLVAFMFSVFAAAGSFIFQPGKQVVFNKDSSLSEKVLEASIIERGLDDPIEEENKENFFDFFSKVVPQNVFGSFSDNKTLQIIFFTVVFSIALASVPESEVLKNFFNVTRHSFLTIFEHALKFLPFLVFTSTSLAVSKVGFQVFFDMIPFLKILFLHLIGIFFLNLFILRRFLKISIWSVLKRVETSILVAFSGSPLAATFPALDFFKKFGETDKQFVTIIAPISMFLNRFGSIFYFCFACFFIGHIYGHHFTFEQTLFIMFFSILGGLASSSSTEGITSAFLISILDPINVPAGQVILVLSSLDFLVSPFLSIITALTNVTLLSFFIHSNLKKAKKAEA
jgi:proton glutamate symport protein